MATSSKPRSQGGGRTSNSEPRQQVFRDFGGCNFQLSPRDFTLGKEVHQEQSDLQMNYVVVQNNAHIADNKTIETRNNLVKLFDTPEGRKFTNANILVGNDFYIGLDDGTLMYGELGDDLSGEVTLVNHTASDHHWKSFAYVDDKLVGMTEENQMWTGDIGSYELENAARVPDPVAPVRSNVSERGLLTITENETADNSFRVAVAWSYVNKYGPTECSDQYTFYANYPVDEWHSGQFARIHGVAPTGYGIKAVEIYYNVGNASTLLFAGRVDVEDGGEWSFDWLGYLDVTSMWPMANLLSPTENITEGVKATHITCIDSRLYFWGSEDEPQRLWIGGNPGNLFSVSPGTGGGFVDVEPGSGQEVRVVTKYKTQGGNSIVTMLCDSPNSSKEQRFNLVENSITISNEQNMKSWQAEQVAGAVGCKSFRGAIVCEDGLYSVSRYGLALTTMTMEYNSQIRANYVSNPIKPAFTDNPGYHLRNAITLECDGVLYLAFGASDQTLDNLLFCYDIDMKSWWTISLDVDEPIIDMLHIDYEGYREGIGIVTESSVYMLPLTHDDGAELEADFQTVIQTGELSTTQPQQNWFYLSQLEFRFDYFIGTVCVTLTGIDMFGRRVSTVKCISHDDTKYNLSEFMRIDLRLQSYQIRISGVARFRMSHFIAKLYTMSAKHRLVRGFDDSQSYRQFGDIHPTFKNYYDIRDAVGVCPCPDLTPDRIPRRKQGSIVWVSTVEPTQHVGSWTFSSDSLTGDRSVDPIRNDFVIYESEIYLIDRNDDGVLTCIERFPLQDDDDFDYNNLINKPKIENVTLQGNKTFAQLNLTDLSNAEIESLLT